MHNRLDILVHVVVNVLSCDSCAGRLCVSFGTDFAGVLELCPFRFKAFPDMRVIAVLDVSVLYTAHVVGVFFGKDLTIFDGLNGGVVVILMDFTVDGCCYILVSCGSDLFVLNGWVDGLNEN